MSTKIVTIDLGPRSYDIYIGAGLIHQAPDLLPFALKQRKLFLITDTNVKHYANQLQTALHSAGCKSIDILTLSAGEQTKSFENVKRITSWLLDKKIARDSLIFAVGGGVIGDITGFCASITLRGIPYIQVPTTLLSQVDSSVGGKTGINTPQGKNLVGSFYQPTAVIADLDTLTSLPPREIKAGYAEVVKYGLINDSSFFTWLEENGKHVVNKEKKAITYAIETSIRAKAAIVEADEKESGQRALLNLGHTFGHALESCAGYDGRLLHGEAVAMGMIMAFDMSYSMDLCSADDFMRVERHLTHNGLMSRAALIQPALNTSVDALYDLMLQDKKVSDGKLKLILVNGIGQAFITDAYPQDLVKQALKQSLGGETSGAGGKKGIKKQWTSIFSSR